LVSGAQKYEVIPPTSDTAAMIMSTAGVPSPDWIGGSRKVPNAAAARLAAARLAAARLAAVETPTPVARTELGKTSSDPAEERADQH
jgi:hypothetical protein